MSPAAVAYLASSHQNLMSGGDAFIISDDIHYSCDPSSPFHHHHHRQQQQQSHQHHKTDFEVQCCSSYKKYDNQSLLINDDCNESDINTTASTQMIRLATTAHDHHCDNQNNTVLLTEMYDPSSNDEKENNLFNKSIPSSSASSSTQLVFGSHKKAENALKLILLSISYIIYMFTWNNHDFQQLHPHQPLKIIHPNNNEDYCSNIPPLLDDTIHSLQNVRRPLFVWYAKTFGCNLDEMENKDLSQYENLGEFFRRSLVPSFRPISQENGIVSPADGLVVQFEPISKSGGFIGSIKGIHYSIGNFLGYNCFDESFRSDWSLREDRIQPGNRLYSTVIYLAPGDYHRFHSPCDWTIQHRRHFSGNLLSVKPSFVAKIPNLFAINERVVYYGKWKYGFFSMAAVGATNVGTVNVFCDQDLKTNQTWQSNSYLMEKTFQKPIMIQKGDLFGEFNLGSTMVMIYEAPKDHIQFESFIGDKVKYGQLLLRINS